MPSDGESASVEQADRLARAVDLAQVQHAFFEIAAMSWASKQEEIVEADRRFAAITGDVDEAARARKRPRLN